MILSGGTSSPPSIRSVSRDARLGGRRPDRRPGGGGRAVDCGRSSSRATSARTRTSTRRSRAGCRTRSSRRGTSSQILQRIWWRLDRALDEESIRASALVGGMEALLSGTTTLVDHHASPNAIDGSLDVIAEALGSLGVRSVLCYEISDRDGPERAAAGIAENRRFLDRVGRERRRSRAALVGAHASFTLSDETLGLRCARPRRRPAHPRRRGRASTSGTRGALRPRVVERWPAARSTSARCSPTASTSTTRSSRSSATRARRSPTTRART